MKAYLLFPYLPFQRQEFFIGLGTGNNYLCLTSLLYSPVQGVMKEIFTEIRSEDRAQAS